MVYIDNYMIEASPMKKFELIKTQTSVRLQKSTF